MTNRTRKFAVASVCATVAAVGVALALRGSDGVSPPAPNGLEEAARTFYMGMSATDGEANRRAMAGWVPTEQDFEALFPGHGERLWRVWRPEAERLIAEAPQSSPQYRAALPFGGVVKAVDLRDQGSLVLKRTLEFMQPDVAVFGGMIETSAGQRAASSVVYVRDRWVWIWQLERAGALIASESGDPSVVGSDSLPLTADP